MLWYVTVKGEDKALGLTRVYDFMVLAHSERGARSAATRMANREGKSVLLTDIHSDKAVALDVRETGVVFMGYHLEEPIYTREEAAVGQW